MDVRLPPWRRRLLSTALFCHLCLATVSVYAQPRFEGEGRVVTVDETQGTVPLDHGPIPGLMPAMRMAFPVQQVERLQGLQVGAVVQFSLQARGPEWVIVTLEPVGESPSPRAASFPAPDFTLPTLSGTSIRLADLQGKVVLLNCWATWCVPCRTEMPTLAALYHRYKDRGLEVLAVNLDMLSTAGVEAFVQEVGGTLRMALEPSWATARGYRIGGLPTTYLIDRRGNIAVREVGERDWMDGVSQMAVEGLLQ
jgi:thiol-disulfide isomerase/thioredoxin/Cu/Ag efflux protein CusF